MGRRSLEKKRKTPTKKVNAWLAELLIKLQKEQLEHLTIDDIARLANKSKSTIYDYFESKEDILIAACQTRINVLSTLFEKQEKLQGSPVEIYKYLVESFIEGISDISISFLHQIKAHFPAAWKTINEFTDAFVELLKALYIQGIKEGFYHSISVDLLAHLDKHFVTEIVTNPSIFSNKEYTLSHLVKDYLKLRLTGLEKKGPIKS